MTYVLEERLSTAIRVFVIRNDAFALIGLYEYFIELGEVSMTWINHDEASAHKMVSNDHDHSMDRAGHVVDALKDLVLTDYFEEERRTATLIDWAFRCDDDPLHKVQEILGKRGFARKGWRAIFRGYVEKLATVCPA